MNCPENTPNSVISQMLNRDKGVVWQQAWKVFLDIYYMPMQSMARKAFRRSGWVDVKKEDLEEVISKSVLVIIKYFEEGKYEKRKYRFKGLLAKIIHCRVTDFIRRKMNKPEASIEDSYSLNCDDDFEDEFFGKTDDFENWEEDDAKQYKISVVRDAWENIRPSFSPQTCLIFEMNHLEGIRPNEIAKQLGIKRNIIDSCVHRVIAKLKNKLNEPEYRKELER